MSGLVQKNLYNPIYLKKTEDVNFCSIEKLHHPSSLGHDSCFESPGAIVRYPVRLKIKDPGVASRGRGWNPGKP